MRKGWHNERGGRDKRVCCFPWQHDERFGEKVQTTKTTMTETTMTETTTKTKTAKMRTTMNDDDNDIEEVMTSSCHS